MASGESHNDPSGLGQWRTKTLRGQEDRLFTILTAYQVCLGNIQSAPIGSSFSREYVHHKHNGTSKPQPRKIFIKDTQCGLLLFGWHTFYVFSGHLREPVQSHHTFLIHLVLRSLNLQSQCHSWSPAHKVFHCSFSGMQKEFLQFPVKSIMMLQSHPTLLCIEEIHLLALLSLHD